MKTHRCFVLGCLALSWLLGCEAAPPIDFSGPTAGWPEYGGTERGERYSPLTQITPANVDHLEVAWVYYTGDVSDGKGDVRSSTAFEATPILVDETLYQGLNDILAGAHKSRLTRWILLRSQKQGAADRLEAERATDPGP